MVCSLEPTSGVDMEENGDGRPQHGRHRRSSHLVHCLLPSPLRRSRVCQVAKVSLVRSKPRAEETSLPHRHRGSAAEHVIHHLVNLIPRLIVQVSQENDSPGRVEGGQNLKQGNPL